MDVCIVPTYRRPEMLWHCLDRLSKCPEAQNVHVIVKVDRRDKGFDEETKSVWDSRKWWWNSGISVAWCDPHSFSGNSFSVLDGYKNALAYSPNFIFMVEDDVMVTPDFFRWHYAVQKTDNLFCSVGHKNIRRKVLDGDASDVILSYADYASLGVCFRREILEKVVEHAKPEYYADMPGYCARTFPESNFGATWTEQDGLIMRIQARMGLPVAFPCVSRAVHVGWYGYHRSGYPFSGLPLERRIEEVGKVIYSQEELNKRDTMHLGDITAVPTETPVWETLRVKQTIR